MVTITRSVLRSRIDLVHFARKVLERPVDDAHGFVLLERELRARPFGAGGLPVQNRIDFVGRQRHGLVAAAHKAGDARRGLHGMPQLVVHFHFHQHVARIEQPLAGDLLAAAQFHYFFGRNQDLADLSANPKGLRAGAQRFRDLLLESRIGVNDVPVLLGAGGAASSGIRFRACCSTTCTSASACSEPAAAVLRPLGRQPFRSVGSFPSRVVFRLAWPSLVSICNRLIS